MTGRFVSEKLQKLILSELYKKRKSGKPVSLNNLWVKHIDDSSEFRITLQYLLKDKEYIWCERHREIGNIINGVKITLDDVTVDAKITEKGVEFFRNEYKDYIWKYWVLRFSVITALISAILWLYNKL